LQSKIREGEAHLIDDPVTLENGRWRLRLSGGRSVPLLFATGAPIERFNDGWRPAYAYDGLGVCYLLGFESEAGDRATWFIGTDGRRIGDRLDQMPAEQRALLGEVLITRGLLEPAARARDGLGRLDPALLHELLALARRPAQAPASTPLAMLEAPEGLTGAPMLRPGADGGLSLEAGWSEPQHGQATAQGAMSILCGPVLQPRAHYLLTLDLRPPPGVRSPLIGIELFAEDQSLARVWLDPEWQSDGARLAYWFALPHGAARRLRLAFRHDGDFVLAGLRVEPAATPPSDAADPSQLMQAFENIGDNCEFGLVQRAFGAEPLGLLRFAGLRTPGRLIRMLEEDFRGLGEPGSLDAVPIGEEFWIRDRIYGVAYHTFRYVHETSAEAVVEENEAKLRYLVRKFREDLEDGEKILVYKRSVTRDVAEILALQAALNRFGGRNRLLWVTESDGQHQPGDVRWVGRRLLRGFTDRISLKDAGEFDAACWLRLCRAAYDAFSAAA